MADARVEIAAVSTSVDDRKRAPRIEGVVVSAAAAEPASKLCARVALRCEAKDGTSHRVTIPVPEEHLAWFAARLNQKIAFVAQEA